MANNATVKIPGNVNFCGGELQNAKLQSLVSKETASEAEFWYDSVNHRPMYNNGTENREFGRIYSNGNGITLSNNTFAVDTSVVALKSDITTVYRAAGSVASASDLPTLGASVLGNVYNATAEFNTTSDFVEGSGKKILVGNDIAVVNAGTAANPSYKFSVMGDFIDISGKQDKATAVTHTESTAVGGANQPIYVDSNGVATACTYELNKTVPSDALFTDTIYTHPTTSGNKHIPSGGSEGQFLKWSADGTAQWAIDNDTKNTAGSTDTSSKIFLIGATSQAANPQTYSNDAVFVDTAGQLNSTTPTKNEDSTVVATTAWVQDQEYLTEHQDISGKQDAATAVTHTESTAVGATNQPVYVDSNGVATACTYELNKSVPADAVFTDTTYSKLSDFTDDLGSSPVHTHSQYLTTHQTIKADGVTGATANRYGACSTAAGTAAKTVSITSGTFSLEAGASVKVKFANANTADSPTLNVNSTGAKDIFHNGAKITTALNKGLLAGVCEFIYDGTQWHLVGNYIDTNTTYSVFVGSGSGAASGLVPAPSTTAGTTKYLREDGSWVTPPDTQYTFSTGLTNTNGTITVTDYNIIAKKMTATNPALTVNNGVVTWSITNTLGTGDVDVSIYEIGEESNTKIYPAVTVSDSAIVITMLASADISAGDLKAVITG